MFLGVWNGKIYLCILVDSIIPNLHLLRCLSLQKLLTSIGELTLWEKGCFATGLATQWQLNQNNSFSTIMQLHYNYTHDVILMSIIVIHIQKFDMWHYEDFFTLIFFGNIDLHRPLWLLMMVRNCDTWHNNFFSHMAY